MHRVWENIARTSVRWAVAGGVVAAVVGAAAGPVAAYADPPGNNGTVKVEQLELQEPDETPENVPHQRCAFTIEFRGFDLGDLEGTVEFRAIPPTSAGTDDAGTVLLTDAFAIGEDEAGGADDLDASKVYDLSEPLAAFTPHPQQGFHVRLNVTAEGSIGADTKFKVFWVSGCQPPTTSSSTSSTSSSSTSSTSSSSTTSSTVGGDTTTSTVDITPGASTVPRGPDSPPVSADVAPVADTDSGGDLPDTGSNATLPLALLALGLVGVGAGVVVLARRAGAADLG